ncbi:MAG TPA: hypothetical protein VGD98_11310 [Ktedonobacteraceae bacterium]
MISYLSHQFSQADKLLIIHMNKGNAGHDANVLPRLQEVIQQELDEQGELRLNVDVGSFIAS